MRRADTRNDTRSAADRRWPAMWRRRRAGSASFPKTSSSCRSNRRARGRSRESAPSPRPAALFPLPDRRCRRPLSLHRRPIAPRAARPWSCCGRAASRGRRRKPNGRRRRPSQRNRPRDNTSRVARATSGRGVCDRARRDRRSNRRPHGSSPRDKSSRRTRGRKGSTSRPHPKTGTWPRAQRVPSARWRPAAADRSRKTVSAPGSGPRRCAGGRRRTTKQTTPGGRSERPCGLRGRPRPPPAAHETENSTSASER